MVKDSFLLCETSALFRQVFVIDIYKKVSPLTRGVPLMSGNPIPLLSSLVVMDS